MGEVFDKKQTDLELASMATLSAIKGRQFGKDVYSTVVKFKDLKKFMEAFPSVQRDINPRKVATIRRYILSGLESSGEVNMRFFSSVTVTCRSTAFYDENQKRMAIDTNESKLSINDGQHRFEAVNTSIDYLEREFVKSKDKSRTSKIKSMLDELNDMVVPMIIFDGLTVREEKQLFHDLNNLQSRPSRNANIRLNQTDLYSKMSRELAEENRYLVHYGVEVDKMSIWGSNKNTILLSTIYASIKEILGSEYKYDHYFLNERNYEQFKERVVSTFDKLFFTLPPDIDTKGKYLTDKSFTIKSICRFICHARNHLDLQLSDDEIFEIIGKIDWTYNLEFWSKYSGVAGTNGNIVFGGGSNGGHRAIYNALYDIATSPEFRKSKEEQSELVSK